MKITNTYIRSLDLDCVRFKDYFSSYSNKDFSIPEFLALDKISYSDKIWVWRKFATTKEAAIFGLKCAESVLHIFEEKYPLDFLPWTILKKLKRLLENSSKKDGKLLKKVAIHTYNLYNLYAASYCDYASEVVANFNSYLFHTALESSSQTARAAKIASLHTAAGEVSAYVRYAALASDATADAYVAFHATDFDSIDVYTNLQEQKNIQFLIEIYSSKRGK